jgi:uncharacterized protein (DUF433 family)
VFEYRADLFIMGREVSGMSRGKRNAALSTEFDFTARAAAQLLKRVTVSPHVCHGQPCIRGLRVMVSTIVDSIDGGMSESELLRAYPDLTAEDIRAALLYARRDV